MTGTHAYGWFTGDATQPDAPNKIGLFDYTAGAFRMMVDSSGNVGIGNTTPAQLLHVQKDQNLDTNILVQNDTAGASAQADVRVKNNTGALGQLGIYSSTHSAYGALAGGDVHVYSSTNLALMADNPSGAIKFTTGGNAERARIDSNGNLGIGTTSPAVLMDLKGNNVPFGGQLRLQAPDYAQITFSNSNNPALNAANRLGSIYYSIGNSTLNIESFGGQKYLALNAESGGNVGIGTASPNSKLEVAGNISVTGTGNITAAGTITGGNIVAKYQDVAEWVPASEQLSAGTVVVLDSTKSNQVISSTQGYDTRVAGVISAQPGIALGESGAGKVLVATTGRVLVRVDATNSPIHIGDLLVTSDVPGSAMKSEPIKVGGRLMHMPGTLIGKALEPLEKGSGKILVLLSLQ